MEHHQILLCVYHMGPILIIMQNILNPGSILLPNHNKRYLHSGKLLLCLNLLDTHLEKNISYNINKICWEHIVN